MKYFAILFYFIPLFLFGQDFNCSYSFISKPGYLIDHSIAIGGVFNKNEYSILYRRFDNEWGEDIWINGMARNGIGICYNRNIIQKSYYLDGLFGYLLSGKRANYYQIIKGIPLIGLEAGYYLTDDLKVAFKYNFLAFYDPTYYRSYDLIPSYIHNEISLTIKYNLSK